MEFAHTILHGKNIEETKSPPPPINVCRVEPGTKAKSVSSESQQRPQARLPSREEDKRQIAENLLKQQVVKERQPSNRLIIRDIAMVARKAVPQLLAPPGGNNPIAVVIRKKSTRTPSPKPGESKGEMQTEKTPMKRARPSSRDPIPKKLVQNYLTPTKQEDTDKKEQIDKDSASSKPKSALPHKRLKNMNARKKRNDPTRKNRTNLSNASSENTKDKEEENTAATPSKNQAPTPSSKCAPTF